MTEQVIGRFAPSPSGRMHAGNIFCALLAWLSVQAQGGRMILRIEDLDTARCRPAYIAQLEDDLRWLGLNWDEGGTQWGDAYLQSRCGAFYALALDRLRAQGLTYPCFCTRAALHAASAPHLSDGRVIYNGACRTLTASERPANAHLLRLRVPDEAITFTDGICGERSENLERECGDFVLCRADGVYAYQLAVVVDDARMGVTEIVRGRDLLSSAPRQLYLYRLLGLTPPHYLHIPLLCAPDGRRLSKRDQDLDMGALRGKNNDPAVLIGKLAHLAGLTADESPRTAHSLICDFDRAKIPAHNITLSAHTYAALGR